MIVGKKKDQKKPDKKDIARSFLRYTNQMANTVLRGVKMADGGSVFNPNISIESLYNHLISLVPSALTLKPESLMAEIDRKFGGVSDDEIANNLAHFSETGEIKTKVPEINKQRLYALRILITSDTAYHDWHIFEKIGSVFNGRLAHFGVVEPLSPLECAGAVSAMNSIRPDTFSEEIKSYIAASCHLDGFYTLKFCRWLSFADEKLQMMNKEETGRDYSPKIGSDIETKLYIISKGDYKPEEEFSDIQALKIMALNKAGDHFAFLKN